MAIKMAELRAKITTASVDWNGENAEIGYHAAMFTPALVEEVQAAAKSEDLNVLGVLLEPVLAYWDLLDENGDRLPTDRETIKTVPFGLLTAVVSTIQGSMRPPAQGD